ncbi:MAG TPA: Ig-like domain repeat protein, partial [Bryobacteraceae bacterium]|nr:Ig-like domain repeat protein [Bryobacteraceae bacterium]
GYDQATGLGSMDVQALFSAWSGKTGSIARSIPAMSLSAGAPAILSSASASITATVTTTNGGTPSGTVAFYFGSVSLGSATLAGASGTASASVTISGADLPLGADSITAQYSGDNSYAGASASLVINVSASTSTTPSITYLTNGASFRQSYAPGMVLTIFGSGLAPSTWSAATVPLPAQLAGVSVTINGLGAPLYYVSSSQLNVQIPYEVPVNAQVSLQVTNNGHTASSAFTTQAAAPGIFTDATGALVPAKSASIGQVISLYMTGQGAVSPTIPTGEAPLLGTSDTNLPAPLQFVIVTVGGVPAQTQFIGIPPTLVGVTQINFVVPTGLAPGTQAVVVSIGGVLSPPASLTIQ